MLATEVDGRGDSPPRDLSRDKSDNLRARFGAGTDVDEGTSLPDATRLLGSSAGVPGMLSASLAVSALLWLRLRTNLNRREILLKPRLNFSRILPPRVTAAATSSLVTVTCVVA